MRLVLDTNVVIGAVLGSGPPSRLIEFATEGEVDLFSSAELIAELAEVLHRSHVSRRLARKGRSSSEVLALYEDLVEHVIPAEISRVAVDPDDDAVLACALAVGADLIISGDAHLLNLKLFHRIPIVTPAEALARLERRPAG